MQDAGNFNDFAVRAQMALDPRVTYFNSASFGPPSRRTADSVAALRARLAQDPMDFQLRQLPALLWSARQRLAQFIGGDPARLLFTSNVTEGISLVASSIALEAPGEILMSDHEYAPMQWCWQRLAKRSGLRLLTFALPSRPDGPDEIVAAAAAAMTERTRLLFVSHVASATGMILPVRELCALARRRGIASIVDGAHGPGFMPLALGELGCDYYAGSGHKWLMAPAGTGFLYCGAGRVEALEPLHVSNAYHFPSAAQSASEQACLGGTPAQRRLECSGTRDICPWLAVPDAIGFLESLGFASVLQRMTELANGARRRLEGLRGLQCDTLDGAGMRGAITSFALPPGCDGVALQRRLWESYRVEVGMTVSSSRSMLRISTHFFNTEAELDLLAQALDVLLA